MDPMDYQMDTENHTISQQQQNSLHPRCPYRANADVSPFNFQFRNSHSSFNYTNRPYLRPAQFPNPWDSPVRQNPSPYQTTSRVLGPTSAASLVQGREPEIANFDGYMARDGLDPRAPAYHSQPRRSAPDNDRDSSQLSTSSPSSSPASSFCSSSSGEREQTSAASPAAGPRSMARLPAMGSSYDEWLAYRAHSHRIESLTAAPNISNSGSLNNDSQQLQLPILPPQTFHASTNYTPFHQQASYPPSSDHIQNMASSMETQSPLIPDTGLSSTPVGETQSRAYHLVAAPAESQPHSRSLNGDSEDDREGFSSREAQLDPANTRLHQLMSRMASASRRYAAHGDEARELYSERARAARRATAVAVKMVASAGALASFEKVNKDALKQEDRVCIICYNEFGIKNPDGFIESPVRLPTCRHLFGDACLRQWLKDSDTCPYCRDKLDAEPKGSQTAGDLRARIALNQHYGEYNIGSSPWSLGAGDNSQDHAILLRRLEHDHHRISQLIQERLRDAPGQDPQPRHRAHDNWGTLTITPGLPPTAPIARGTVVSSEYGVDARRRFRGRPNSSRVWAQSNRPNAAGPTRATRNTNHQGGPMRAPLHNSTTTIDEGSSSNDRVAAMLHTSETLDWSFSRASRSNTTDTTASLQAEQSPLAEANEPRSDVIAHQMLPGNSSDFSLPSPIREARRREMWRLSNTTNSPTASTVGTGETNFQGILRDENARAPTLLHGLNTSRWEFMPPR
ncbi:MAG: hypothetical protein M1818_001473 [Claussenomyces sp. TS43310]|nr:MAG: hypothetical protein M1818_001473 [Claussenomyces sp. TS43310]